MVYVLTSTEVLGYVGGVVLAVALVPQLIHTIRTQSTKDIAYGWQFIYICGLILNYVYFVLANATAAWVTLTFEVAFAVTLLLLKIQIDGFGNKSEVGKNTDSKADSISSGDQTSLDIEEGSHDSTRGSFVSDGNIDLNISMDKLTCGDAFAFRHDPAVSLDTLVQEIYRGTHIMIDVTFERMLEDDFGDKLLKEMCWRAEAHSVRVVHSHIENFDGTVSPPGFASVALLDESHMSAHSYSEQGMIAFDVFTCGSNPEGTRKVARDVLQYLQKHLGDNAVYHIHRMPRFPNSKLCP